VKKFFVLFFVLTVFVLSFALTGQIDTSVEKFYTGTFTAHEGSSYIYLEKNTSDISDVNVFINGLKVNFPVINDKIIKINTSKFTVEGTNDIYITNSGKTKIRLIVPFLTLEKALPEKTYMNSDVLNKIDSVVESEINKGITPGAVVLIARNGYIVKEKAYGYAQKYDIKGLLSNPVLMNTIQYLILHQ